jgi:hypothetical protein
MRGVGTYFEQVPKTVVEKILARQNSPAEGESRRDETVKKWTASKAKARNPEP